MPNVKKVRDGPTELHYVHPHASGWIAVALGGGGAYLAWTRIAAGSGLVRPLAVGLGALILLGGIWSVLYRLELTIDLDRRRVRWMRGLVFSLESGQGGLDETIEAVVLKEDVDREGSKEEPARAEAEALAQRLGVPLEETREL